MLLASDIIYEIPNLASPAIWLSLLTLTFLEVVLGIDNIIFISIVAARVPKERRAYVTRVGLILAMVFRIILLLGISWLVALTKPVFSIDFLGVTGQFSGQSLVLILGGIFLLYKSTTEIGHKLEGKEESHDPGVKKPSVGKSIAGVLFQIILIDMVFSFDSILTAVGMTTGISGALYIMIAAVVISILIMLLFAVPVGRFVNDHPTIQMLALSFLILIGFMLVAEGAHYANVHFGSQELGTIPKGYLYFAISFSLLVEFLNMRVRKRSGDPVRLNTYSEQAEDEGLLDDDYKERERESDQSR